MREAISTQSIGLVLGEVVKTNVNSSTVYKLTNSKHSLDRTISLLSANRTFFGGDPLRGRIGL